MSKSLEDLKPEVAQKARALISAMNDIGDRIVITSTLRSDIEQLAMFAQGRSDLAVVNALRMMCGLRSLPKAENTYTISKCDGQTNQSRHQQGRAFDVVLLAKDGRPIWRIVGEDIERYKTLGVIAKAHGLTWGGDWAPFDAISGIGFDAFHMEL